MASGVIVPLCPSIDEHQANQSDVEAKIHALRAKNQEMRKVMKRLSQKCDVITENIYWTRKDIVDLEDRAKFVRIASISNPAAIGQYAPKLKGPPPHQFYQEQVAKIRATSRKLLLEEARRFGAAGGADAANAPAPPAQSSPSRSRARRSRSEKRVPCNFSPFQGETENSVQKQPDNILLGLRSPTHWVSSRKIGALPPLLSSDGPDAFKEHTASWMAREGKVEVARNRDHISTLARTRSAPHSL